MIKIIFIMYKMEEHGYVVFCTIKNRVLVKEYPNKSSSELAEIIKSNWCKLTPKEKSFYTQIYKNALNYNIAE